MKILILLCLPAVLLAEVMPLPAADVRAQISATEQQSAVVKVVVRATTVRSDIASWQVAERLNLQSWKWASAGNVFELPKMSLNSVALEVAVPIRHWEINVASIEYTAHLRDLLNIRVDGPTPVSHGPLGVAIKKAAESQDAATTQALIDKANSRRVSLPKKSPPKRRDPTQ